jgi:uncharacterized membrane protein (UPF0127 family)
MAFFQINKNISKKSLASLGLKLLIISPFYVLAIIFVINLIIQSISSTHAISGPNVQIGKNNISVMIADDFEEWGKGLSNRHYLGEHNGMIFIFPQKQVRNFWMKNMHFPLDIIWIEGDYVIKIDERLPPEGNNPQKNYSSILPVDHVLEVNGGYAEAFNINLGDKIIFNLDE